MHPFICYIKNETNVDHINFVVISDCLKHDTVPVHLFQRKLITKLKEISNSDIKKKNIYFSDGAASQ